MIGTLTNEGKERLNKVCVVISSEARVGMINGHGHPLVNITQLLMLSSSSLNKKYNESSPFDHHFFVIN